MDALELAVKSAEMRARAREHAREDAQFEQSLRGLCGLYGKTLKVEKQKRLFKDRNGNLREYEAIVCYQVNML